MSLPSPLPLDDFERAVRADRDVLGMLYFGSLGRGTATRHSDLDIFAVVPDRVTEPYKAKPIPLLQLFGEIHWLEMPKGTGYVGPHWTRVDIEFAPHSELERERSPRLAGATVIKDCDGFLAEFAASCTPEQISICWYLPRRGRYTLRGEPSTAGLQCSHGPDRGFQRHQSVSRRHAGFT